MKDRSDGNVDTPITIPSPPPQAIEDAPTSEFEIPRLAREVAEAEGKSLQPCLVILGGLDMGRVVPVGEQGLVIGRSEDCELALRDDAISRRHIRIIPDGPDKIVVDDLGSTNGTFVRGARVDTAQLHDGEKLFLGRHTVLKFLVHDDLDLSYQRELYESSTRDVLTGAFNRRYFTQKMTADVSFGRRHGLPLSLLLLDIDHFKQVNDTHGHSIGDEVLRAFTRTVANTIRTEDMLARYGGEEFAIIAAGTGLDGGLALGERIRKNVGRQKIRTSSKPGAEIDLTVSAGVASLRPGVEADAPAMIAIADDNLYAAKHGGRNRVVASEVD